MKYTTETFIEKAKEKHGDKFSYGNVNYVDSRIKVIVTCPHHGDFEIEPASHLRGTGCRACQYDKPSVRKYSEKDVLEKFKEVHGNRYDYSKFEYKNAKTKSTIICREHGEFEQRPQNHMKGEGCPVCGKAIGRSKKTTLEFIKEAKKVHGEKYSYEFTEYLGADKDVVITCPEHGDFIQEANTHLRGGGCTKCSYEYRGESKRLDVDLIRSTIKKQAELLDYEIFGLDNVFTVDDYFDVKCKKHGLFKSKYKHFIYNENKCPKCAGIISSLELVIRDYFSGRIPISMNDRSILGGKEIDLLFPTKNIGVEVNGIIWHSTAYGKGSRYHLDKTNSAKEKGIDLIHIFEDELNNSKDIVLSLIENKLGLTERKIAGRDCIIKEVSSAEAKVFLDNNHLKGGINSLHNIALIFNDEIVAMMTFSNLRKVLGSESKEGEFELIRFCTKKFTRVLGAASKLLKYFEQTYTPKRVISYADLRFSEGALYTTLGFTQLSQSSPNYFYVKSGSKRLHRFLFRKSELVAQGFDETKSEREIMEERGYSRIYDCGSLKFEKVY